MNKPRCLREANLCRDALHLGVAGSRRVEDHARRVATGRVRTERRVAQDLHALEDTGAVITELVARFMGLCDEYLLRGLRTLVEGPGDFSCRYPRRSAEGRSRNVEGRQSPTNAARCASANW